MISSCLNEKKQYRASCYLGQWAVSFCSSSAFFASSFFLQVRVRGLPGFFSPRARASKRASRASRSPGGCRGSQSTGKMYQFEYWILKIIYSQPIICSSHYWLASTMNQYEIPKNDMLFLPVFAVHVFCRVSTNDFYHPLLVSPPPLLILLFHFKLNYKEAFAPSICTNVKVIFSLVSPEV